MKPQPNSKRTIKKKILKELRKLFPGMAVYVRKKTGFIQISRFPNITLDGFEIHTYEYWQSWIGKRFWTKYMCEMRGHYMDSCDAKSMLEMIREDRQIVL